MSTVGHAPLPWRYDDLMLWDANGDDVFKDDPRVNPNCEFIVQAVNGYADLLAALKEAGEVIHSEFCTQRHSVHCERIDAAIAKAESREATHV